MIGAKAHRPSNISVQPRRDLQLREKTPPVKDVLQDKIFSGAMPLIGPLSKMVSSSKSGAGAVASAHGHTLELMKAKYLNSQLL